MALESVVEGVRLNCSLRAEADVPVEDLVACEERDHTPEGEEGTERDRERICRVER
jgi:hypothetical protein